MIPLKHKVKQTELDKVIKIPNSYIGHAYTIQGVYYSSTSPASKLHIYDGDGDECYYAVPGQENPHVLLSTPITVKLPLSILDETAPNSVTIYGYVEKSEFLTHKEPMV